VSLTDSPARLQKFRKTMDTELMNCIVPLLEDSFPFFEGISQMDLLAMTWQDFVNFIFAQTRKRVQAEFATAKQKDRLTYKNNSELYFRTLQESIYGLCDRECGALQASMCIISLDEKNDFCKIQTGELHMCVCEKGHLNIYQFWSVKDPLTRIVEDFVQRLSENTTLIILQEREKNHRQLQHIFQFC
jgi:hypothetical protein